MHAHLVGSQPGRGKMSNKHQRADQLNNGKVQGTKPKSQKNVRDKLLGPKEKPSHESQTAAPASSGKEQISGDAQQQNLNSPDSSQNAVRVDVESPEEQRALLLQRRGMRRKSSRKAKESAAFPAAAEANTTTLTQSPRQAVGEGFQTASATNYLRHAQAVI